MSEKIVFDAKLKNRCAQFIRDNPNSSIRSLFANKNRSDKPASESAIMRHFGNTHNFLREIGINLSELCHIGNNQPLDLKASFFSRRDGKLFIKKRVKTTNPQHYNYLLSNGIIYDKSSLVQYSDLIRTNPKKEIDIQEFFKVKNLIRNAYRRAVIKNIPFDISIFYLYELYDFSIPTHCAVFKDTKLDYYNKLGKAVRNSPSLDRISPKLGYVKGNVRIISHSANTYSSDMSVEDCLRILKDKIGPDKDILIIDK